jgi:hypothetical protein
MFEEYLPPIRNRAGNRIELGGGRKSRGSARLIGSGCRLAAERMRFVPMLAQWRATHKAKPMAA